MRRIVVDTDVASYIFKWHPLAPQFVALLRGNDPLISFMTEAEMWFGAFEADWGLRKRTLLDDFLADFGICYPDRMLCALWAHAKHESNQRGRPISAQDAWIAATAIYRRAPLLTNNEKDYKHLRDLEIIGL